MNDMNSFYGETLETLGFAWLVVSAGTLIFLSTLAIKALRSGGIDAYRKLHIGFPVFLLILLGISLCWPWSLRLVGDTIRKKT